jgi:4-amino-4-deoxy-L-arabinose transferase-like glycosyltransferase
MRLEELELSAPSAVNLHPSTMVQARLASHTRTRWLAETLKASGLPVLLGSIIAAGILLRLFLPYGFQDIGIDENLYRQYVLLLERVGISHYPILIESFIRNQFNPQHQAILPPTRLIYIVSGYLYHQLFGLQPLVALRAVSCQFSILTLLLSAVFCWRLAGAGALTAAVTALVACAPTQIHLGQHSLIDGVFGFCALLVVWLLWENLQRPNHLRWLIAYGAALGFLVMAKESSFFIFAAILAILVINRWANFGRVTRQLVWATLAGVLAGFSIVVLAAGGFENFTLVFTLLQRKVPILPYTILTGDGPWHRYLIDLMLVSPAIMLLAIANLFASRRCAIPGHSYLAAFAFFIYGILTSFPDGMNLRYILVLDMPLRFFAASQLLALSQSWGRWRNLMLACVVLALCTYELHQHHVLFVKGRLYELISLDLLRAQNILK